MKFIFYLFLFSFLSSCGLFKGRKEMHYGEGSGSGNFHKDTISVNLTKGDSEIVNATIQDSHITLTSGNEWYPKPPNPQLKIVKITNTKVISSSTNMSDGRVVYSIPEQMKIRSTYQVLLRISKSKATLSIYDSLAGTVRTSEIPVTQTMEVHLVDPSKSFEIIPDNNAVQLIDGGETYTEWTWNVTPIKVGSYNLKIVVSVIRDGNKKDIVYEDSVKVEIDIPTQVLFFWNTYWQWIIGTFILPFILWFYKKKQKEKEEKEKPPS